MSSVTSIAEQKREEKIDFKHLVVATDFSASSKRALAYAVAVARGYGSEIALVHAIPPEPRETVPMDPLPLELDRHRLEAEEKIRQLAEEAHLKDFQNHILVQQGSVWDVLSSIIDRYRAGLLVLGTHGRGGLKKLALGSVAEEVLRLASCPVLTIGPNAVPPTSDVASFKTILFATDFGPACARAFPYALSLAVTCQAKLILVHMVPPLPVVVTGRFDDSPGIEAAQAVTEWQVSTKEESIRRLRKLVPQDAKLTSQPDYLVGIDFLPEGILVAAALRKVDLIVMGANRVASARMVAHMPWTLTHDVICKAKCPVLTVRS
jgi:nucleotide-binding universal stress UspA family protein